MLTIEVRDSTAQQIAPLANELRMLDAAVRRLDQLERGEPDPTATQHLSQREEGVEIAGRCCDLAMELVTQGPALTERPDQSGWYGFENTGAQRTVRRLLRSKRLLEEFVGGEAALMSSFLPGRLSLEVADAMLIYGPRRVSWISVGGSAPEVAVDRAFDEFVVSRLSIIASHAADLGPLMHERGSDTRGLRTMKAARWICACVTGHNLNMGIATIVASATADPLLIGLSRAAGSATSKLLATAAASARRSYLAYIDDRGVA